MWLGAKCFTNIFLVDYTMVVVCVIQLLFCSIIDGINMFVKDVWFC